MSRRNTSLPPRPFQSQGRFFGGCCIIISPYLASDPLVSIAGAILWGVLRDAKRSYGNGALVFQSQGRFFGGCCRCPGPRTQRLHAGFNRRGDSLGGAAMQLWATTGKSRCFNRRGDSLGGAANLIGVESDDQALFQSQGRFFGGCCVTPPPLTTSTLHVSIAGAILWGVLLQRVMGAHPVIQHVSIAGAILWGVLPAGQSGGRAPKRFQSQGRFFGGCCPKARQRHLCKR